MKIILKEFDIILNQVALSINNGIDLFDDENDENLANFENINEIEEAVDLEGVNYNELEITNFIDLSTSLLNNKKDEKNKEVRWDMGYRIWDRIWDIGYGWDWDLGLEWDYDKWDGMGLGLVLEFG
ncbi:hypothetical protein RclHR1_06530019 [Rhizophagus clarus]|uniref:Uncharacterized protein n=1 Tax=Rhizophagus clarus TaxID=94130 RepID=A0A2Z6SJ48_9GLOM|nr:hypothetical protein RclHR1_06530019 [Rhizophagus clarus]